MQDILSRIRAKKADEGFTLIELLVVVVIIGVLVAIAIPIYLNYRQGASDKSAQSDARGAISAVEQFYSSNSNTYPTGPTTTQTASFDLTGASGATTVRVTLSDNTRMTYVPPTASVPSYKICATNTDGSGKVYLYNSATGGSVTAQAVAIGTCA